MIHIPLVDENDREIGTEEKVTAHLEGGKLHRAFSVFVFNNKGELLLQKRASSKMLWPGYWSNTCCSHPHPGEDVLEAGERRLNEEIGFSCKLKSLGHFIYTAHFEDIGTEKELCHVLVGEYNGEVSPNNDEIEKIKWMSLEDVKKEIKNNPSTFTPWFKMELEKFFKE